MARAATLVRRRGPTLKQREARTAYALLSPTLVVVLAVVVIPILATVVFAFERLRLISLRNTGLINGQWTLDNFANAVTASGFVGALTTTIVYSVVGTALAIGLGLAAALAVRHPFRGRTIVRGLMLLPYVAPVVAVTFTWRIMLDPNLGIVNAIGTGALGWDSPIPFLTQRTAEINVFGLRFGFPVALATVLVFQAWRYFPFAFLFILARLQAVQPDLEEAASVDGATPSQRFRYVVLPQLSSVIALLAVLRLIWTFNEFDDIYLLTGGAAGTEVVSVRTYNLLIGRGDIGGSAAVSLVLAALLAVMLFVYFRYFVRRGEEAM
jgi:multiple sugar transport system permease protein